jgi:protein disulfide isomerase
MRAPSLCSRRARECFSLTLRAQDGWGLGGWRGEHVISSVEEMNSALKTYNKTGLFMEFFLPWCGHSRRVRPEFRRASAGMAGKPVFARVDCSSPGGARVCLQFDVQYHPHMLLVVGGKSYEYTQRATAAEITRYCHRVLGPDLVPIHALGQLVDLLDDEQVLVAAFVEDETQVPEFFIEAARLLKDSIHFVLLEGEVFAEAFGLPRKGASFVVLRLMQQSKVWNDDAPLVAGQSEAARFAEWVTRHHEKLVETITQENFQKKVGGGIPSLLLFRDDSAASDAAMRALYKTAAEYKDLLNVCSVNGARYQKLATKLGVKPRTLPALVLVDVANETQFVYPPMLPMVEDEVLAFASRVIAGQERATLRSAESPVFEDGPVYTLVADRFRVSAMDSAKDVVVNFHTRWCGFCNLFAPTYRQLALTLAHVETLVFYDFDCSENDPDPALNITSYPTLMLFSAHNKTALTYMGDRRCFSALHRVLLLPPCLCEFRVSVFLRLCVARNFHVEPSATARARMRAMRAADGS